MISFYRVALLLSLCGLFGCVPGGGPADGEAGETLPPVVPQLEWGDTDRYGAPACVQPPWTCPADYGVQVAWQLGPMDATTTWDDYTPPTESAVMRSVSCRLAPDDPGSSIWHVVYDNTRPERVELGFILRASRPFYEGETKKVEAWKCASGVDYACAYEITTIVPDGENQREEKRWEANCRGL